MNLQDLKTFVAVNTSSNIPKEQVKFGQEVSISWFDNKAGTQTPGCESWEARVALTPFLAHQVGPHVTPCIAHCSMCTTAVDHLES